MAHPPLFALRSHRLRIGLLLMTALFVAVNMRLDMSMAIVCMVNSTSSAANTREAVIQQHESSPSITSSDESPTCARLVEEGGSTGYRGTLHWTPAQQSRLVGATFYGALVTVPFSGFLCTRFSATRILTLAIFVNAFVTLLTPTLTNLGGYAALFAGRIVLGLSDGMLIPLMAVFAARWFPAMELSTISAIYTSGNQLASSFTPLIAARLCAVDFLDGWPLIFYTMGLLALTWLVLWIVFASDHPHSNKWAHEDEKNYLAKEIGTYGDAKGNGTKKPKKVPYLALAISPPLLACYACSFAYCFAATILQTLLPTYFKQVLKMSLSQNGAYTTLPFLAQLIFKNVFSPIADFLKRRRILSMTTTCKLFQVVGSLGTGVALTALALFVTCENPKLALILLVIYGACFSCGIPGFFTAQLCVAPQYTGIIASASMTVGGLANMAGPNFVALLMKEGSAAEWRIVFLALGAVNILSGLVFQIFGSSDVQDWALRDEDEDDMEKRLPVPRFSRASSKVSQKSSAPSHILKFPDN